MRYYIHTLIYFFFPFFLTPPRPHATSARQASPFSTSLEVFFTFFCPAIACLPTPFPFHASLCSFFHFFSSRSLVTFLFIILVNIYYFGSIFYYFYEIFLKNIFHVTKCRESLPSPLLYLSTPHFVVFFTFFPIFLIYYFGQYFTILGQYFIIFIFLKKIYFPGDQRPPPRPVL
jgi:hypothetical protein